MKRKCAEIALCLVGAVVAAGLEGVTPAVRSVAYGAPPERLDILGAPRRVLELPPGPGNSRNSEGDFAVLKDGRILFAYSKFIGGTGADHDQCVIAARESSDKGETWGADRIVATNELVAGGNVMSVSFLRLKDDRLALFYGCKLSTPEGLMYSLKLMRTSSDEGRTWSAARDITAGLPKSYRVLNNARVVRLKSGRILVPLADHGAFGTPGRRFSNHARMFCVYSDDDGATWYPSAYVDRSEADRARKVDFQEPGVIELKDGRVLLYFRTTAGRQYYAYSSDGGRTWGPAEPSPLFSPLSPATIHRLSTGELVCFWNDHENRPDLAKGGPGWATGVRTPLTIGFSSDGGRTWTNRRNIEDGYDSKNLCRYWYCYTAVLELDDRLLVAYCAEDGLKRMRLVVIPKVRRTADKGMLTIAERGRAPAYAVVIPLKASPAERYAAIEFVRTLGRQTGVSLPVVDDSAPLPEKAVVIGSTRHDGLLSASEAERASLGPDGFRLVAKPPHLFVVGSPRRGVLYGVYELLERFGGCRWYASWCEKIPTLDAFTVPGDLNDRQVPAFEMRQPFWWDVNRHRDFAARLRVNGYNHAAGPVPAEYGGDDFRFGAGLESCHTFQLVCDPNVYFDAHPEYFSLVKGKRLREKTQLCLTNPDVLDVVTSNVLARIARDPKARFFGVSQNDWRNWCECPACKALDEAEGSHAATVLKFVNALAERVERKYPDVTIETLAYMYTRTLPKTIRPRKNVLICLCTWECDFLRPLDGGEYASNVAFRRDIDAWKGCCPNLYVWDYVTDFSNYPLPFPNFDALVGNVRFFRDRGVRCLFEQGDSQGSHANFAELKAWLLAKLMWNPDRDAEPLIDDFINGFYGKAAPFVRRYFDDLRESGRAWAKTHPRDQMHIYIRATHGVLTDGFLSRAEDLWRQAREATKGDAVAAYNVRMGAFSVDYALMERLRAQKENGDANRKRELADRLFSVLEEAPDIRLCESKGVDAERTRAWREPVPVAKPAADGQ